MGVNSLPKTVTRQRHGCDLNPGPSVPKSSTLTTQYKTVKYPSDTHTSTMLSTNHYMKVLILYTLGFRCVYPINGV